MCSTTPKTKAASPAVTAPAKIQKPAPGGGGGDSGGAGGPPPVTFQGAPEHVPELTFIVQPRVTPDDYLAGATTYHTNCGLQPREIHSIDHMLDMLAADASPLQRIRVVSHANGEDLLVPLFGQTTVRDDRHTFKEHLNAFADSDELGLLTLIDLSLSSDYHVWNLMQLVSMIRSGNAALLAPFGMDQNGVPSGDLSRYIRYCCDFSFVNINLFHRNGSALPAADKAAMLKAIRTLIGIRGKAIEGQTFGTHVVTQADLQQLSDNLTQRNAADLGLSAADAYNFVAPAGSLNTQLLAGDAADAVQAGFRTKLNKVRARFSSTSMIDIRGCRLGADTAYMRAVQAFMGRQNNAPQVSGPEWYQAFAATNSYHHPATNAQVHTLLQTGSAAADIRGGFATWLTMTGMDPAHTQSWTDALTASAAKFCLPAWKNALPALPLATPGIDAFKAMNFTDTINTAGDFFNVPAASKPSAAQLTAIDGFISTKLAGWGPALFAAVDDATTPAKLSDLYLALKQINLDLGQSVVPATAPSPLKAGDISGWQTALAAFIDTDSLGPIKALMTAIKQRIDDATDPGMNYYALRSGMPVFVFADHETVVAHRVNIINNRLVVLDAFADEAFRQWPPLLWAEPLPAANTIGTLHAADFDARRFQLMVALPDGGDGPAAACPNPSYMNKITSV
jgi:hypothetical protein